MKVKTILMMGIFAAVGMFAGNSAMAQEAAAGAAHSGMDLGSLGAGLGLGLAALGGALGQGKTAGAALEGISRNPSAYNQIFLPMIIGLALIESLVIYALIIAFKAVK